ncbi:tRNA (guanine-N(7)-)-methyltransferase [bacterium HR21]|nr:tRNA (guanine-N(7)-)-methyltransferase [bacterium HR21]
MDIDRRKYPLPRRRHHGSAYLYVPRSQLRVVPPGYPPVPERLSWSELFANGRPPCALDVGCGEGSFLLRFASQHPEQNILGLEVRRALAEWLAGVIRGEQVPNAAVLWYSVVNGLPFLEDASIARIFYLFPDPWPKKRHHKRRALTPFVLREFARVLRPDGLLYIATDFPALDEYHRQLLDQTGYFQYEEVHDDADWGLPLTDREEACRRNGIPYVRLRCSKRGWAS